MCVFWYVFLLVDRGWDCSLRIRNGIFLVWFPFILFVKWFCAYYGVFSYPSRRFYLYVFLNQYVWRLPLLSSWSFKVNTYEQTHANVVLLRERENVDGKKWRDL
jgi:hypothetical protein